MAITAKCARSPATACGSSAGASQMPIGALRASSASRSRCHSASGTIAATSSATAGSAPSSAARSSVQVSSTICPSLMSLRSAIHAFFERLDPDATHRVDEQFFVGAVAQIHADQLFDYVGHLFHLERGADHFAQRRLVALRATDRDLIELCPMLVHAQDADVAHVMVAARIHAAGHVQFDVADLVQVV